MRATRKLLDAASSTYKSLLKPRSQWDTLTSAFATTLSILSSQTDRDKFVETVNKGIINPGILGQADMGFFMTLALHHDLSNDLFLDNGFNVEEFMEAAEPSLERFQEVLYSLDRNVLPGFTKGLKEALEKDGDGGHEDEGAKTEVKTVTDIKDSEATMEKVQGIETAMQGEANWKKKAEENPETLYGQLYGMVSEQLMDACEKQFVTSVMHCYMNQIPRMCYTLESGEIHNVALVSARAHEVIPKEEVDEDEKNDDNGYLVDESLTPITDKKYPVAAQIEVIYSISQSFRRLKLDEIDEGSTTGSEKKKEEEEESKSDDDEQKLDTAWVAVFEGMLSDGPNGSDNSLRWKLIDNRPAWEFPGKDMPR